VQLCLGAFKAGMREFTANVSGNDLVRVTGYMVRLSDLEKFRAEGSRTNTTWLERKPPEIPTSLNDNRAWSAMNSRCASTRNVIQIESRHHDGEA
jgi:hypothetical protein